MSGMPAGARISTRPETVVRVERNGAIREIILDRPSRKNALTIATYRALTAAFTEAANDATARVVILSSSGGPFSVGNDFGDLLEGSQGATDGKDFAAAAGMFQRTLASFPKFILAAVDGLAAGAGATILLHCDMVLATETAAFEFPSTRLGMLPDAGASVLLTARFGLQRATEWFLFGDRIDVATAVRLGLVNAVIGRGDLKGAVLARAEAIMMLPQGVLYDMKYLLREPLRTTVSDAIARELERMAASLSPA